MLFAIVSLPYSPQKMTMQAIFNSMRQQVRLFGYGCPAMKYSLHQWHSVCPSCDWLVFDLLDLFMTGDQMN